MNILLFISIITIGIIFVYSFLNYKQLEGFIVHKGSKSYIIGQDNTLTTSNYENNTASGTLAEFNNTSLSKYNQYNQYIPDKENYSIKKDSGLMAEVDNPIDLMPIEYTNLNDRIEYYKKLEQQYRETPPSKNDTSSTVVDNVMLNQLYSDRKDRSEPLVRKELTILVMDSILSEIKAKHDFDAFFKSNPSISFINDTQLLISSSYLKSYSLIKNWILEAIYAEIISKQLDIKYTNTLRYKFKNDKILRYQIDRTNNLKLFEFISTIYRTNKENNFNIYFSIIFDYKYMKYYVKTLMITGKNRQQYIEFSDFTDKNYKLDRYGVHLSLSADNPTTVSNKYICSYKNKTQQFVDDYYENIENISIQNNIQSRCFFKDTDTKDKCVSFTEDDGIGIWDTKCTYDSECPFFKRNKNYPNSRGGCNKEKGTCEMPINITLLGYKEYDESTTSKAICHGCKPRATHDTLGCNMCCEEQKDKSRYPYLKSPDYSFPGDFLERYKYKDSLEKMDIAVQELRLCNE